MTSTDSTPRIRPVVYEPPAAAPDTVAQCPHCGAALPTAATAVSAQPTMPVLVEDLPDCDMVEGPVRRLLALVLEVVDGRRPADQLAPVLAPPVLRYTRAARLAHPPARASRVRSLRLCRPTEHAVEAAAVAVIDWRVRAVAARLHIDRDTMRCVALRIL